MIKSLKRVLATASTLALLATNAGVALAQTFRDVPTDAWYYDYVEQLVNDGVVDAGNTFRPNDPLNRAELVKIVITAIDGLADYQAPASPTFDDVSKDAWYYDYVESAVQLGIVEGYKNSAGQLTGKFGPGDDVNRAQATKILVNAFSVPTTLTPLSPFPDVVKGQWFHDYVLTAYNQSVLDGYGNGKFGPADPVTRAQVAKLVVNSQNPVLRTTTPPTPGEGTPVPTSTGALEVSLNDMSASSSTLPISASSVKLASFDFTAAQDDVLLQNLLITRGGVGRASDWSALYIYEGAVRLTTGRTLNADTNTATFALNKTVDAGTTKTLTLVGDVDAAAGASNQHYFYVASAADVTSNAESVAGDFPVAGNTFTMGGATTKVNDITVAPGTAPSQPTIGQKDAEVATIKLTAGPTNDIAIHQISLTQGGSLASSKLVNLRLLRGTDEVATAAGFDSSDRVTFVLSTPFVIPKGQNKTFYVRSDIDGGRTNDTVKLYLDENTDLVAIDQQYGYGAIVINNFGSGVAANLALKGGDVTITDNGPAAKQLPQNATNNHLLDVAVTGARDLTVRDMFLKVALQYRDAAGLVGTGPNVTAMADTTVAATVTTNTVAAFCITDIAAARVGLSVGDTVQIPGASTTYAIVDQILADNAANCGVATTNDRIVTNLTTNTTAVTLGGAVKEKNPYEFVKNIKVIDIDSGSTLMGPLTNGTSTTTLLAGTYVAATGTGDTYSKVMSEDWELVGGEARHIGVLVDTDTNLPAGYSLFAALRFSDGVSVDSYLKDMAANEFVKTANIVGAGATALQGKLMTTAANSLTVSRAATPTSQTYVKGEDKVPALGVSVSAGDAGEITIKKLTVRVYGDDGLLLSATPFDYAGAGRPLGDVAANTLVSSVTLYDGNDVVDGPRSLTLVDAGADGAYTAGADYYKVLFDNLNLKIAKGSTKTYVAKAKLLNTMGITTYVTLDLNPAADIAAEDMDANTITASGNTLNPFVATTTQHNPLLTVVTSGTLSVSSEGNPDAKILVAGSTMQLVSKYRFNALREGYSVNKVTIVNDIDATPAAFEIPTLVAPDESTNAVSQIAVKYTDMNGVTQTKTGTLSGGSGTLSGLTMYVPTGTGAFLEVYANVSEMGMVGETLSGKNFRLGLRNGDNNVSSFEAVGVASSSTENNPGVINQDSVKGFVVRKSVPTFAKASGLGSNLIAGENRLFGFTVTADSLGAVSFGRLSFTITNGAGGTLDQFKFYRGSTLVSSNYATGTGAFISAAGVDLTGAGALVGAGATADAIVAFISEETVGVGSSQTYYLDATRSAVAAGSESIQTKLAIGDESVSVSTFNAGAGITGLGCTDDDGVGPHSGPFVSSTNTGRVTDVVGLAKCALFTTATGFVGTTAAGVAQIWSDKSADNHYYISGLGAGSQTVTDGSGSYDWTNGHLLKLSAVASHSVSK